MTKISSIDLTQNALFRVAHIEIFLVFLFGTNPPLLLAGYLSLTHKELSSGRAS